MDDELVKRLRKVQWSVTGEPCAEGNVDETCSKEAADRIEALEAQLAEARDALAAIKLYSACGGSRRKAIETLALLDQPNNAKERPHD